MYVIPIYLLPPKKSNSSTKAGVLACSLGTPLRLPGINSSGIMQRTLRTTYSSEWAAPDSHRISLLSFNATSYYKF